MVIIGAFPGDTITFSSVSFQEDQIYPVPYDMDATAYALDVILEARHGRVKRSVSYTHGLRPYKDFKEDFLELEVEDPSG